MKTVNYSFKDLYLLLEDKLRENTFVIDDENGSSPLQLLRGTKALEEGPHGDEIITATSFLLLSTDDDYPNIGDRLYPIVPNQAWVDLDNGDLKIFVIRRVGGYFVIGEATTPFELNMWPTHNRPGNYAKQFTLNTTIVKGLNMSKPNEAPNEAPTEEQDTPKVEAGMERPIPEIPREFTATNGVIWKLLRISNHPLGMGLFSEELSGHFDRLHRDDFEEGQKSAGVRLQCCYISALWAIIGANGIDDLIEKILAFTHVVRKAKLESEFTFRHRDDLTRAYLRIHNYISDDLITLSSLDREVLNEVSNGALTMVGYISPRNISEEDESYEDRSRALVRGASVADYAEPSNRYPYRTSRRRGRQLWD